MGQRLGSAFTQVAGVFQFSSDRTGPGVQTAKDFLESAHASSNQEENDKRQESDESNRVASRISEATHEAFAMTFRLSKGRQRCHCAKYTQREEVFHRPHRATPLPW